MHMTPVEPDTDHMDDVSCKTREIATRIQQHLKLGISLALVIDWASQDRTLEFYKYSSEGRLFKHVIPVPDTNVDTAFQTVLSEAVIQGFAETEPRKGSY